jgi:hypothetical protein
MKTDEHAATAAAASSRPLLAVQGDGTKATNWASTPPAVCADGSRNRQPFYWGMMVDSPPNVTAPSIELGVDISKVPGMYPTRHLCIYPDFWVGNANRSWTSSPSAIWPALTGPYCDKKKDPSCTPVYLKSNGGCPQNVSLEAHAAAVAEGIKVQVPVDFDGYVSWDYEGWAPQYDGFLWSPYHLLCGEQNGTVFEATAKAYYLKTLEVAKALRPKAKFGFYGMPTIRAAYDSDGLLPDVGSQASNDQMAWLWEAVDFFAPELYLGLTTETVEQAEAGIRLIMNETTRLSNKFCKGRKRVVTYSNMVDDRNHSWPIQSPEQIAVSLLTPFEFGITDAVMIWGDSDAQGQPSNRRQQIQAYLTSTIAPVTKAFTESACACAKATCSGHGRCYDPPPPPPPRPPPSPPGPHPPPPPGPHPKPGPEACHAMMVGLGGPTVGKPGAWCNIPPCKMAGGCKNDTARCFLCIQNIDTGEFLHVLNLLFEYGSNFLNAGYHVRSARAPAKRRGLHKCDNHQVLRWLGPTSRRRCRHRHGTGKEAVLLR